GGRRSSVRFATACAMLLTGKTAGNRQKQTAGSKSPRRGQGGVHDDLTPELRASCCSERCCCSCLARHRARRNQVATGVELSKESRYFVGRKPNTCQTRERDERRQVYHRALCGRRDRTRASGAGCSRQRHGRVRPFLRRIL